MDNKPNDNSADLEAVNPADAENIEDVLLEFDREPSVGGGSVVDAAIEPEVAPTPTASSPSSSSTTSPFGPPLANFGSTSSQASSQSSVNGSQVQKQPAPSATVRPTQPAASSPVIQDVKPAATPQPIPQPTPATPPPAPVQDEIKAMVSAQAPTSPASSAIESLLTVREEAEVKNASKKKDIKLPSGKKSSKLWLWVVSAIVALLAASAAGWFFLVKTPADQAAATYRTQAVAYLESIDATLGQFSGDIDATLASLESIDRPSLESTLLHSFSYSNDYQAAETLQRDVNTQATRVIDGIRSLDNAGRIVALSKDADAQGEAILTKITTQSTAAERNAAYGEYVAHLEGFKSEVENTGVLSEEAESLRVALVGAIDNEIVAYRDLINEDTAQPEGATNNETEADDSTDLPTTGDGGNTDPSTIDSSSTEVGSDSVAQASVSRQDTALAIEEYVITNSQLVVSQLKTDLSEFIASLK